MRERGRNGGGRRLFQTEEPAWAKKGRAKLESGAWVTEFRKRGWRERQIKMHAGARCDNLVSRAEERGLYPEGKRDLSSIDQRGAQTLSKHMLS